MTAMFTCEKYHLDMPAERQSGFCSKRHRNAKPGDYCLDCARGIKASEEEPMALYKKTCKCGDVYEGGPTAKACPKCRAAEKAEKKPKTERKKAEKKQGVSRKPRVLRGAAKVAKKATDGSEPRESIKVLETLVAIGAVSQAQVEATRQYVRHMYAGEQA